MSHAEATSTTADFDRRHFLRTAGAAALAAGGISFGGVPSWGEPTAQQGTSVSAETTVRQLYQSLSESQQEAICFAWDHVDPKRGLLRTRVANNWQITDPTIAGEFFTDDQRDMIRAIYEGILHPDWHERFDKQLEDDSGGYGENNSIAIFGKPASGKFEFVLTGRHMTMRCDGDSAEHLAFGGPIFYGHAADGFNEGPTHEGNVFWPQAVAANEVFKMFDGRQRELALVKHGLPPESSVAFRSDGKGYHGIPVTELSQDQVGHLKRVVQKLVEPYRQAERDEVAACLKAQGGLEACSLAFYEEGDIGKDGVWDNWRLEGPSFVWHYRGAPHVHVWAHVADDPRIKLNA